MSKGGQVSSQGTMGEGSAKSSTDSPLSVSFVSQDQAESDSSSDRSSLGSS